MDIADRMFLWRIRRRQELPQRVEQDGDLPVVLLDFAGQIPVRGKDFAQFDESPHMMARLT